MPLEKGVAFFWTNLNPHHQRMLWAYFGWNGSCGSGEKDLKILSPWKRAWPFIWTNLNSHYPRLLCAMFGWNWPSGFGEEDFKISSMYFRYFVIICPWKRAGLFIWINLNSHHPRMLCAKFSWSWPSGSGEEDF